MASSSEVEMLLKEYITYDTLPQRVKIVEGFYNDVEGEEFSAGDVIDLQTIVCPTVELNIHTPKKLWSITVPTSHPSTFILLPIAASSSSTNGSCMTFKGVTAMCHACPLNVRVNKPYVSCADMTMTLEKGDHLKLMRFVRRFGQKYLECKSSRQMKLVLLPVFDTGGEFQELQTKSYYTLTDLVNTLPRTRKLKLADDIHNKHHPLPGQQVPSGAVMTLLTPQRKVKYVPFDSPGTFKEMCVETDITVSPRQDTYSSHLESGHPLKDFTKDNERMFPISAVISDWFERSTVLEAHGLQPGSKMKLFAINEKQSFLAHVGNERFFCIPKSYSSNFRIVPRVFQSVDEIPKVGGFKFKAMNTSRIDHWSKKLHGVESGVEYKVTVSATKIIRHVREGHTKEENEVLPVQIIGGKENDQILNLPLYLQARFEEILPSYLVAKQDLPSLSQHETEFPIDVEFIEPCDKFELEVDPLPRQICLTIICYIREPCVLVSGGSRAHAVSSSFQLPLRTKVLLTFLEKLKGEKPHSVSALGHYPEEISRETFNILQSHTQIYYEPPEADKPSGPILPLRNTQQAGASPPVLIDHLSRPPLPIPRRSSSGGIIEGVVNRIKRLSVPGDDSSRYTSFYLPSTDAIQQPAPPQRPKQRRTVPLKGSLPNKSRKPLPPPPDVAGADRDIEEEYAAVDYEALTNASYEDVSEVLPLPTAEVPIPSDSNLCSFQVSEMLSFLQQMKVPYPTLMKWHRDGVTGSKFGQFSDEDLEKYDINNPIMRHFRDKTKLGPALILL